MRKILTVKVHYRLNKPGTLDIHRTYRFKLATFYGNHVYPEWVDMQLKGRKAHREMLQDAHPMGYRYNPNL